MSAITAVQINTLVESKTVKAFANKVGIHTGIVVGRLQYEEIINMNWMNDLKVSLKWMFTPKTVTADLVREKLEKEKITEEDIADAVRLSSCRDDDFEKAAKYVLDKNKALYERLS